MENDTRKNNFLLISPDYPHRLYNFATRLRRKGFKVLGLINNPPSSLNNDLAWALTDPRKVFLNCYGPNGDIDEAKYMSQIYPVVKDLNEKHGPIRYVESFNEFWLPADVKIRKDFDIEGMNDSQLMIATRKSQHKKKFIEAGVPVVEGELVKDLNQVLDFSKKVGGRIIIKPDHGVGSGDTYILEGEEDIRKWDKKKNKDIAYFMELFIPKKDRQLYSFDGLTDKNGEIVISAVHAYSEGNLESKSKFCTYYYNLKISEIPAQLLEAGRNTVKAFGMSKRFFHIEYFKIGDKFYGLEMNPRPPGVINLDMFNHAKGIDIWSIYADVMNDEIPKVNPLRDSTILAVGRKERGRFKLSCDQIRAMYMGKIAFDIHFNNNPNEESIIGDYSYLFFVNDKAELEEIVSKTTAEA